MKTLQDIHNNIYKEITEGILDVEDILQSSKAESALEFTNRLFARIYLYEEMGLSLQELKKDIEEWAKYVGVRSSKTWPIKQFWDQGKPHFILVSDDVILFVQGKVWNDVYIVLEYYQELCSRRIDSDNNAEYQPRNLIYKLGPDYYIKINIYTDKWGWTEAQKEIKNWTVYKIPERLNMKAYSIHQLANLTKSEREEIIKRCK